MFVVCCLSVCCCCLLFDSRLSVDVCERSLSVVRCLSFVRCCCSLFDLFICGLLLGLDRCPLFVVHWPCFVVVCCLLLVVSWFPFSCSGFLFYFVVK